jgi:hypothetical protein
MPSVKVRKKYQTIQNPLDFDNATPKCQSQEEVSNNSKFKIQNSKS